MTIFTRILFSLCFTIALSIPAYSEPQNLSILKKEIIKYHDSGLYAKELQQTITLADQYIIQQAKLNKNTHQHLALVLDIDETSLSNYNNIVKRDFVGEKNQIHQDILNANAPVIKPMLSLYQDAQKHGIKVFFVTGRNESERLATQKNLMLAGYTNWSGLYLRPKNYTDKSIIPFKSQARADITKKGYTIIATIGDQYSDIKGGYAKKGFKLPNPFYYLP